MNEEQRKIEAGELEKVKASEEATRRNVKMILDYTDETRKALIELRGMFDVLQNNVMNVKKYAEETRRQVALLQQEVYAKGTIKYDDDGNPI